jgi:SAM-dependent methyltransferase
MSSERVYPLDSAALDLFDLKGAQGWYPAGSANGVKVRRVMQIIRDFAKLPFNQLRIRDFACGEGVYAIEAALRGADVHALDARTERMDGGARLAKRLGLDNLRFEQIDIRNVTVRSHGSVDVILFLGILYHIDDCDVFSVLENIYKQCEQFVIIDTHIALRGEHQALHNGKSYEGVKVREHADGDPHEVRKGRLGASLDNPLSFWFTRESLCRALNDVGFSSICECHVPFEPTKPTNRITMIAAKGETVKLSSYPWVNDKTEQEIKTFLAKFDKSSSKIPCEIKAASAKQLAKSMINGALRPFGIEIRRIENPAASATSSR